VHDRLTSSHIYIRYHMLPCRTHILECISEWWRYLSEARCKWFAYGPTDATVNPSPLSSLKSRLV